MVGELLVVRPVVRRYLDVMDHMGRLELSYDERWEVLPSSSPVGEITAGAIP